MGRELPRAVQHVEVRYLGNDSHYMDKQTFRLCTAIGGSRPTPDLHQTLINPARANGKPTFTAPVLPHDIAVRNYSSGISRLDAFRDMSLGNPSPLPRIAIEDGIHAVRVNLSRCIFDEKKCEKGLSHLKSASYEVDRTTGTILNRIKHDDSSHALDAFRYLSSHVERKNPTGKDEVFGKKHVWPDLDYPELGIV